MSRSRRFFGTIVAFSALSLAVPSMDALADQGRGRGHEKKADKAEKKVDKDDKKDNGVVVVDRDGYLRVVREYAHTGSLPPGLAKRQSLPPGLRNQLHERGALPPGLRTYLVPVPPVLIARLPPVPPYYQRYFAGDDLIVVDTRTNRIPIIIVNVWR